jgi:hypothetical protein
VDIARKLAQGLSAYLCVVCSICASSQSQTSGRIVGQVSDIGGAVIIGASITAEHVGTGERRSTTTGQSGAFGISFLPAADYRVSVAAAGFATVTYSHVTVAGTANVILIVKLDVAPAATNVDVTDTPSVVQSTSPELSTNLDTHTLTSMPLSTRNSFQLVALAPGVSMPVTDNRTVGRNTPNFSVDGARFSQNSLQINGVDASDNAAHDLGAVAIPAPETIREVLVQTSLYDAFINGAGGGRVQVTTQSGTNMLHGSVYEYFRGDTLNANDPDLKAAGLARPVLRRNVFGVTLGGPIRKNRMFYFLSYQGTRERNGATDQSLYKDVLIAPGLTEDRSEATLLNTFHPTRDGTPVQAIDPVALNLLNAKLPDGKWLIPTPQPDGRVTGSIPAAYDEDQFNTNFDFQFGTRDSLSAKFFFANAPQLAPLVGNAFGGANLPGFGMQIENDNRVLSVSYIRLFGPNKINEARVGYNFIRDHQVTQEPIRDSNLGIQRTTAANFPGLSLILLARDAQGASIGSPYLSLPGSSSNLSLGDFFSWQHGKHGLRLGGGVVFRRWAVLGNVDSYGEIDFPAFNDFLTGSSDRSVISSGLTNVDFRTTDYEVFVQDDWKLSPTLTLNLGLCYELDLPAHEIKGRMATFDPALYQPRMKIEDGAPVGPPISGFVLPGNVAPQYDVAGLPKVSSSLLKSVDPNNFAPRIGFSWSPLDSGQLVLRAGYGIFYSRPSFLGLGYGVIGPPFYTTAVSLGQTFANPFPTVVPENLYPVLEPGIILAGNYLDRNNRTPYFQQFNASVQYELARNTNLQVAYAGSRGLRLYRFVGINQARIATVTRPVVNAVTGEVITTNTPDNALLRVPMQGVWTGGAFVLNRTDAQSTYHSLQVSLIRSVSHVLEFQAAYTFSKSIDNASGVGGGTGSNGVVDRSSAFDTAGVIGNQLDPRSNRGVSDFDRPQRFVAALTWDLPKPHLAEHITAANWLLANWHISSIVTLMSGLPIDVVDPAGGSLYGSHGARPNWAQGANREKAMSNVPLGYYFNPYAFAMAIVQPGQPIPSAHDSTALAGDVGTDFGNVGRNILRGPGQSCVDFSALKRWRVRESASFEFRADFFNLFNHPNRNNPISDISVVNATGGSIDPVTGRMLSPGDFGRIIGTSSSPRIVQLAMEFIF